MSVLVALMLTACSPAGQAPGTDSAQQARSDDNGCLAAVQGMLEFTRQAVNDMSSRPERRAARQALYNGWTSRLDAGDDPCLIYADIGRAATTI